MERELLGSYLSKNHRHFADNSPRTHRRFSQSFQSFSGNVFVWSSQNFASSGISSVFRKFFDNSPKIFRQFIVAIKESSYHINQLFVPYGKYSDLMSFGPYVKTAVKKCAVSTSPLVDKNIICPTISFKSANLWSELCVNNDRPLFIAQSQ